MNRENGIMTEAKPKQDVVNPDYVLTSKERGPAERAFAKMKAKTAPRLKLEKNDISIDHPDRAGEMGMMDALGTGDRDFVSGVLMQLANASGSPTRTADESDLNFMLSVVTGVKPNDQIEAMIRVQMAVIHSAAMKAAHYLARSTNLLETESAERTLNKLVRSFTALVEALKRHRGSGEPNVGVQNVSVGNGGQAIVGNVTQNAPAVPTDKSAISPAVITHAHVQPMEIIGNPEREVIPAKPKTTS